MTKPYFFEDYPVLGNLPTNKRVVLLQAVNEPSDSGSAAAETKSLFSTAQSVFPPKPYDYTGTAFGFIPANAEQAETIPIQSANTVAVDHALKNQRIEIRLDCLHVESYPGWGNKHEILLSFYARNTVKDQQKEPLHYNVTVEAHETQSASVVGLPLFIGLGVGVHGVDFMCQTVNVRNNSSHNFLKTLESDAIKSGLKLAATAQPALIALAGLAQNFVKVILESKNNIVVHRFHLGLDFDQAPTGVRLALGTYIAAQVPTALDWSQWYWHRDSAQIRQRDNPENCLPYNYLMFRISTYSE